MPRVKNIKTKRFQWDFLCSLNRFPSMVAGWGTGKTMWALHKGIILSKFYRNNLGLIVRNKFTDLRDSTMKDFTRYTGLPVPQGTKEAKIGSSVVLFRHAKELSGLQNINIGWAYIEQAEEFPTDTQFSLLRGRLRRDLEWDEENFPILESNPMYDVFCRMRDNPLRQIMVIANAGGHNWVWKKFIKSPQEGYSCIQATSFDNKDNLPADFIDDLARMELDSPAKYSQYVMNCHDEIDLDACYYADDLTQLRKAGQIGIVPHRPDLLVHMAADVGLDCTAIWFFQVVGQRILWIDYYENTGKFADHYSRIIDEKRRDNHYDYGRFIMPVDAKKREMVSKNTFSRFFSDLGYKVLTLPKESNVDAGINNVSTHLRRSWFNETKCELGLEALQHYRREYDEELRAFREKPLHDWASHPSDSIRYACKAISKGYCGKGTTVTREQVSKWGKKYRRTG